LPFIGDLPLLGTLFSHKHLDRDQQTLVVFITPRIVMAN
jgi:type II secretory pathway component HofQ